MQAHADSGPYVPDAESWESLFCEAPAMDMIESLMINNKLWVSEALMLNCFLILASGPCEVKQPHYFKKSNENVRLSDC